MDPLHAAYVFSAFFLGIAAGAAVVVLASIKD